MVQFTWTNLRERPGVGGMYRRLQRRPAWVWMTAIGIGALPLMLLAGMIALAALLLTAVIYAALSTVHDLLSGLANLVTGNRSDPAYRQPLEDQGRRNVRVVDRDR